MTAYAAGYARDPHSQANAAREIGSAATWSEQVLWLTGPRDHSRLKTRLRPMRGLKTDRTAGVVIRGHALMQNIRRRHYELGIEANSQLRVSAAFEELIAAL